MPWFKDKEGKTPKELEGKSADDVLKLLADANEAKEKTTKLEQEREAEKKIVTELSNNFNSVKAKLDAIEANAPPPPKVNNEPIPNFIEDPDGAFNARVGPVVAATVQTGQMTAVISAQNDLDNRDSLSNGRSMDGRLFRYWMQDIRSEAQKYQATALIDPRTWLDIFYKIKGWRADELSNPETRKKNYPFLESAASNVAPPNNEPKKEELTPQELKIAERMGVTPENYMKRKKAMTFVGA